jgi:precorrin-4 methylase
LAKQKGESQTMLAKLRAGISDLYGKVKEKVSKLKKPSLPKSTADVEWKDGQPVFKDKNEKK